VKALAATLAGVAVIAITFALMAIQFTRAAPGDGHPVPMAGLAFIGAVVALVAGVPAFLLVRLAGRR
jgi:uncharacterized membrane protein YidH (DUF202 family)